MSKFTLKNIKFYLALIFSLLSIVWMMSACSMGKRQKFMAYNNSLIECFSDPNYYKKMKSDVKSPEELEKYLNNTKDSIARSYDYKDYFNAEELYKDYPDDISIKQLKLRRDSIVTQKLFENVLQFQFELLKKGNPLKD